MINSIISIPVKERSGPSVDLRMHCEMHTPRNHTTASVPWVNAPILVNVCIISLLIQAGLRPPPLEMPTTRDYQGRISKSMRLHLGWLPLAQRLMCTRLDLNTSSLLTNF